jgi:PAS domain S-box-containing protein
VKLALKKLAWPKMHRHELLAAILLGLAGFLLNTLELPLGWGMQFVFGNAIIFAFIRVLAPQSIVLAISISGLWTMILWNHPWAWLLWVFEAIFIAVICRRNAPVQSDVIFWTILAAPLLLLTSSDIVKIDELSLSLVVIKQAANGILNVVIGELIYAALIGVNPMRKFVNWPKVKLESAVITVLMAIILIPTVFYMVLAAPDTEQTARKDVGGTLENRLLVSSVALNSWVQSRSLVLRMHAEEQFQKGRAPEQAFFDKLSPDFEHITIIGNGRRMQWSAGSGGEKMRLVAESASQSSILGRYGVRLVTLPSQRAGQSGQFAIIVPFSADGKAGIIIAQLRDKLLDTLIAGRGTQSNYGVFLVSPLQGTFPLKQAPELLGDQIKSLSQEQRLNSLQSPVLLRGTGYSNFAMTNWHNAYILRSARVAELPEWQVFAAAPLAPAAAKARMHQLQLFTALMYFVFLITLVAAVLSQKMSQAMGRLLQSAADLADAGLPQDRKVGRLIQEVQDISGTIASAGKTFGRERGALASYKRRLKSIAQHAPVVVYALDVEDEAKGSLVYVSESLEEILGYSPADAMDPGWWSHAIHPEDYEACAEAFAGLEAGKVVSVEYRLLHKDGHYAWVYDTMSVEANPHSGTLEAVGVIMDISERKAAAEQLLQADKMASLGRMIAGTAHELNQPLNFIKMAASNLRENAVRDRMEADRFLPKLENILAQVERASAILLQMRIFGRIPKESPYPINVKTIVDAVVMMVAPQLELDGTQVEVTEKGEAVHVQALPVLLEQVLLNLLLNANDAIRARYGAGNAAEGRIKITVKRSNKLAVINVEDNGVGIPSNVLLRIFDPFYTTKAPKDGTGLGLSISYGIVSDLGGVLRAKSNRNGARFTIELPLADPAAT